MKKILLILLFIPLLNYGQIPLDKKLHFAAGAGISLVTYATVIQITNNHKKATIYSIVTPIVIGLAKELIDEKKYKGFDSKDWAYTVGGGLFITTTINIFPKKNYRKTQYIF